MAERQPGREPTLREVVGRETADAMHDAYVAVENFAAGRYHLRRHRRRMLNLIYAFHYLRARRRMR